MPPRLWMLGREGASRPGCSRERGSLQTPSPHAGLEDRALLNTLGIRKLGPGGVSPDPGLLRNQLSLMKPA